MKKNRKNSKELENYFPTYWRRQAGYISEASIRKKRRVVSNSKDPVRPLYWQIGSESLGFPLVVFCPIEPSKSKKIVAEMLEKKEIKKQKSLNDDELKTNATLKHSETIQSIVSDCLLTSSSSFDKPTTNKDLRKKRKLLTRSWQEPDIYSDSDCYNGQISKIKTEATESETNSQGSPSLFRFNRGLKIQKSITSEHLSLYSSGTYEADNYLCRSLVNIDEDRILDNNSRAGSVLSIDRISTKSPVTSSRQSKLKHFLRLDRFVICMIRSLLCV